MEELTELLRELSQTHRYDEVAVLGRQTLETAREAPLQAIAHYYLGIAMTHLARPDEAIVHLKRARRLFEKTGDPWTAAEAMDWTASALHQKEEPSAYDVGRDALQRYQSLNPHQPDVEARMLEHLGTYLILRRDYPSALECYDQALEVAGRLHDLTRLARIYHGRSMCRWTLGHQGPAIDGMLNAVMLYRVENDLRPQEARVALPRAENDLGMMLMERGQLDQAEEMFCRALEHLGQAGVDHHRANLLLSLADLRSRTGRQLEAAELIQEALQLSQRLGERITTAAAHRQLAELLASGGDLEGADTQFQQAIAILDRHNMKQRKAEYEAAYQAARDVRTPDANASAELA